MRGKLGKEKNVQGINVTLEIIGTEGDCLATCYKFGRLQEEGQTISESIYNSKMKGK